jgi:hypothetical protein
MNNEVSAVQCECSKVTLSIGNQQWSMPLKTFKSEFPKLKLEKYKFGSCDHCVNNWGTDICACGSGKRYQTCKEGWSECGTPMQDIEEARRLYYEYFE